MKPQFFGPKNEVLLESDFDLDRLMVFLPGLSGKAHSERFAWLAQSAEDVGIGCARLALWEGEDEVNMMRIADITDRLDTIFAEFVSRGYQEVTLIGKSFGGGMALIYKHELIAQKILWAPAIGVGEGAGNVNQLTSQPLGELANFLEIQLGVDQLAADTTPINIIHGTADDAFPVSNSEAIVAAAQNGTLHTVEGADHSFKTPDHEAELIRLTESLLQ